MNINELKEALRYVLVPGMPQSITPFIWGPPGIGKSQSVAQIAEEFSKIFGHPFLFIDLRLSQLESADLRGIPVPDLKEGICRWLPPEFLPFEGIKKFENTWGILLLDEMNRARTDVLQAAFQLVLDRQVGLHKILETWFIVAAGNYGQEDKTDVNEMDAALKNRFIHFDAEVDLNTWLDWATKAQIHDDIIGYIRTHNGHIYHTVKEDDNVFVTPRSWEKFSKILKANQNTDPKIINAAIGKSIINGLAGHFHKYLESKDIVSAEDILFRYETIKTKLKTMSRDQMLMLNNEIATFVGKRTLKETPQNIEMIEKNLIKFMEKNLELDNKIAFMQSLYKSCSDNKNEFANEMLRKNPELSNLVVSSMSTKKRN